MADQLTSGRGTSRFVVDTPSAKLIDAQGRMSEFQQKGAMRQNLLERAASLLPDYKTLSDTLLEYNLHTADAKAVRNQLDSVTSAFMDAYSRDPFFTFTAEGRNAARRMQKIVTNPDLLKAQDLKKQNDKELDKALEEGVLDKILVNSQGIGVIRNGRKMYVAKPKEDDHILTVNDEYQYLNDVLGAAGGKYVVPMRSFDKAMASVRNAFSQIGDTEWKQENIDPNSLLSSIQSGKSNKQQVDRAVDLLINKGGLSMEDWNTLKSEYLSGVASGQTPGSFDEESAKQAVVQMVLTAGQAKTSTSDSQTFNENPFIGAKAKANELEKGATLSGIERGFYGMNGTRPRAMVTAGGIISAQDARKVGADLFQTSTVEAYREDLGVKFKSHKLKDLPLTANATEAIYAMAVSDGKAAKAGEFVKLPADVYRHGVLADGTTGEEDAPAFVSEYVGPDGKIVPYQVAQDILSILEKQDRKIPQEYRKYISMDEKGQPGLKVGQFMDGVVYVPKQKELWGSSLDTQAATTLLEEHGYTPAHNSEDVKYINEHSGTSTNILENSEWITPDGYYKVRVKLPMNSYFEIRGAGGENVYTQLEDAHFDTGNFQNQSLQINPSLLDDNAFLPNLKTQGMTKFSQLK